MSVQDQIADLLNNAHTAEEQEVAHATLSQHFSQEEVAAIVDAHNQGVFQQPSQVSHPVGSQAPGGSQIPVSQYTYTEYTQSPLPEPLLQDNPNRFVLFPIKYHDIWEMYKKELACFWTVDEMDLQQDMRDWEKLTADEQHFIKYVLAFFAAR